MFVTYIQDLQGSDHAIRRSHSDNLMNASGILKHNSYTAPPQANPSHLGIERERLAGGGSAAYHRPSKAAFFRCAEFFFFLIFNETRSGNRVTVD